MNVTTRLSLFLGMALACSGCIGMPRQSPLLSQTGPVQPPGTTPMQVTPESEGPVQSNKLIPEPEPTTPTIEEFNSALPDWGKEPAEKMIPKSESKDFLEPRKQEQDAPRWKGLIAPGDMEVFLGEPQKFPVPNPLQATQPSNNGHAVSNTASTKETSDNIKPAEQTKSDPKNSEPVRTQLKSTAGRDIQIVSVGDGAHRVMIIGSIYGNDPESIALLDNLMGGLSAINDISLQVVRTSNPDGLAEHVRTNDNGVDLNRNFPSSWFPVNPNSLTGPRPASEVETQHLMRLMREFKPERVIHVHSSFGVRPLVMLNKKFEETVQSESLPEDVDVGRFGGEFKVGSLEEFVSLRLDAAMATVQLPPQGFQQMSVRELMELALLGLTDSSQLPKASVANTPMESSEPPKPDGEKGFVEFLPPPPNSTGIANASSAGEASTDSRYYELPPPPRN